MKPGVWLALIVLLAVLGAGFVAWNPAPASDEEALTCPVSGLADEDERPRPCGPAGVSPEDAEAEAGE